MTNLKNGILFGQNKFSVNVSNSYKAQCMARVRY